MYYVSIDMTKYRHEIYRKGKIFKNMYLSVNYFMKSFDFKFSSTEKIENKFWPLPF